MFEAILAFIPFALLIGIVWWFFFGKYDRPLEKWSEHDLLSMVESLENEYSFLSDFFVGVTNGPIKRKRNREERKRYLEELRRRGLDV